LEDPDHLLGRAADADANLKRALDKLILTVDWGALTPRERWQTTAEIVRSVLFLRRRYPWFQLAGHSGQFEQHHSPEWVLKMVSEYEAKAFLAMQGDPMAAFTPIYKGIVTKGGKQFFQLQNLLFGFTEPCGMDCKMGFRTYLAKDVKSSKTRLDLLTKLIKLDKTAKITDEERIKGVTKRRYMQHREVMSSTSKLGFRIEAIKMGKSDAKTFKGGTLIDRADVADELNGFMGGNSVIRKKYLAKLRQLRAALVSSDFFKRHEVVGSSLLLLHDRHCEVGLWMIDFGKTVEVDRVLDHLTYDALTSPDAHEDGYLLGLDNLMSIIERCG
jgi:1D-myo-inositol-triphosphate 3-kinase